jgi:kinesin family protein 2/24
MLRSWEARHSSAGAGAGGFEKAGTPRLAVMVSYFEIYGNKLFDLGNGRKELKAMVDHRQEVQVVGMAEHHAPSVEALLRLIDKGNAERMTGSTGANADSSRSHAVLSVTLAHAVADGRGGLTIKTDTKTGRAKAQGKFSFVDLAGSERGADTAHTDRRTRQEGADINKSLLALKECIRSLYQEAEYNPFRGSK